MKNCQNPNKSKSFVPNLLKKAFVCTKFSNEFNTTKEKL